MQKRTIIASVVVAFLMFLQSQAAASAATNFTLPSTLPLVVGSTSSQTIGVSLGSADRLVGVDVIMTYDPTIVKIVPQAFPTGTNAIFPSNTIKTPTPNGSLQLTSTQTQAGVYYTSTSGSFPYASFSIQALSAGQTTLRFTCVQGATNDSNIVEYGTGNDLLTCASLPTMTVTVTNPTPTPSPTPAPTPTPVVLPVCLTISSDIATPKFGDAVRFTCGQVAGATSYAFRYRAVGTTTTSGTIAPISSTSNISQPLVMSQVAAYDVECQACIGTACSPYTAW